MSLSSGDEFFPSVTDWLFWLGKVINSMKMYVLEELLKLLKSTFATSLTSFFKKLPFTGI